MAAEAKDRRQRLSRIERKPKPVYLAGFNDFASVGKSQALRDELDEIIESIERGDGVADAHYRAGIDRDGDGLLEERGVMHLHLGGKSSDTLVFLVQYADRVVLLETNTHVHFRTQPAGKNIVALTQAWFQTLEREMRDAGAQALSAKTEGDRKAAAEVERVRGDAIARFKAKLPRPE